MLIKISSASVFSTWLFLESFYCLARFEFKTFGFFFWYFLDGFGLWGNCTGFVDLRVLVNI